MGKRSGNGTFLYGPESQSLKNEGKVKDDRDDALHILKYVGEWLENKRSGEGTEFWRDGSVYRGQWQNDKRHGFGRQFGPDGVIIYKGQWSNDEYSG